MLCQGRNIDTKSVCDVLPLFYIVLQLLYDVLQLLYDVLQLLYDELHPVRFPFEKSYLIHR
jgi:hypothetical protein